MTDKKDLIVNAEADPTERQIENDYFSKKARKSFLKLKSNKEFMERMKKIAEDELNK